MIDRKLAQKLFDITEFWSNNWDVWSKEEDLKRLLAENFDSKLEQEIYYLLIFNEFDEIRDICLSVINN